MIRLYAQLTILAACTMPAARAASLRAAPGGKLSASLSAEFKLPQVTSKQFLIISSPTLGKVVYTTLNNFHSTYGQTYALIDSGLDQPSGIALDPNRGHLYVADRGVKKIFRYSVFVGSATDRYSSTAYSLSTDNTRLTILSGHDVEWVAVDRNGDVFYSAKDTKNINKITSSVMSLLGDGVFSAESLKVVSEKEQEAAASADITDDTNSLTQKVTDAPPPAGEILSVYESAANPHVTTPAGLATDGLRLVWANAASGKTSGSVVLGEVNPTAPPITGSGKDPALFKTTPLSNISDVAQGVCKAGGIVFFTTPASAGGAIYGVAQDGGAEFAFATGVGEPQGLAWDGDNTVYVADSGSGSVSSFPAGRLVEGAPLQKVVDLEGAFGVAVLTETDEAFVKGRSGATTCSIQYIVFAALWSLSLRI